MLRELLSIFRSEKPLMEMGVNFRQMLELSRNMTVQAGEIFFSETPPPGQRTEVYKTDVKVNKLERKIRKQVIAHLSIRGNSPSLPYCLLLMSLVKDVERQGDYAKNLAEVREIHPAPLPDDDIVGELREIRAGVESAFESIADVFAASDHDRAVELLMESREIAHRCDALVGRIAHSDYDAATATALVMATRFYKRLGAHSMNVLSSVVMPLHKLDYYDEKVLGVEGDDIHQR